MRLSSVRPPSGGQPSWACWLRVWAPLFASLVVVLGLGCSLGGDGGAGGAEAVGASHGASVSDTAPLVCPEHATPTIPGGLLPPTPAEAEVAGSIAGAFEVNDAGAAVYSLRLEVPPGRAGLEPDLTLTYDSDHENGLLGMGFRLGGLSSNRRCGQNFSDEGALRAVAFDENDRFCLDGRKLFAVRGTYGAPDAEYRNDPDSFTRVTQQGDAGGGPASFTAFAHDGRIYEYGSTDDARVGGAHGTIATWALSSVRDRLGNVMTYHYATVPTADGAHQHRLTAIRYTGHVSGLAPERSVEFDYAARFDAMTKYVAGEAYRVGELLTGLRLYGPGHTLVRDYTFTYSESPSTRRARLAAVVECAGEGSTRACKPSTAFGWGDQPSGFSPDPLLADSHDGVRLVAVRTGDVNGDGTDDLAYLVNNVPPADGGPPSQALWVKYNQGRPADDPAVLVRTFEPSDTLPPYRDLTPLDFDKDGRVDLLLQRPGTDATSPVFRWLRSTGTAFVDAPDAGRPRSHPASPYHDLPTSNTATYFADLNGDGLADVVSCGRRGLGSALPSFYWTYQLQLPDARAFDEPKQLSHGLLPGGAMGPLSSLDDRACRSTDVLTLDLDGDGASELLFATRGAVGTHFQALSVRDGALVETTLDLPAFEGEARGVALDLNGDGLRDLVVLREAPAPLPDGTAPMLADVFRNTGAALQFVTTFDDELRDVHVRHGYVVLDYDGDGREDLLLRADGFEQGWRLLKETGPGIPTHLTVTDEPTIPFLVPFDSPIRSHYLAVDLDADGDDDLVTVDDQLETVFTNTRDELRQDRLLWVRDGRRSAYDDVEGGLRAMTLRVDYDYLFDRTAWPGQALSQPPRYRHDPGACAPVSSRRAVRCFAGEKRVVTHTLTGGNGAEKLAHDVYYQDARVHRLGAGWLGFGARQIVDRTRQRVTELAYDNERATLIALPGHPTDAYPYVERFPTAGRVLSELVYTDPFLGPLPSTERVSDLTYVTHRWRTALAEGGATSYVLADESHSYRFSIANFRDDEPHVFPVFGPFDPSAYPFLAHVVSQVLEVDAFGNVLRARSDDGVVEATVERTFDDDANGWLLGRATSSTETSRPLGPNAAPAQTRLSTVRYQPGTPLPSTLTVSDPTDATSTLTETRTYDAFGNLTYRDRVDPQGRRRQTCVAYEPEGIFPSVVTQAAEHETRLVYDRALGVPLASLDPNGLATKWSYDPFGRTTRARTPEGGETTVTRTRVVVDDPTTPANDPVRFTQVDVRASGAERRELWSAEGRLVRTEAREFSGLFAANRFYDRAGRLVAEDVPTLAGRAAPGRSFHRYDGFDRPTQVAGADGLSSTFVYDGLVTLTLGHSTPGGLAPQPTLPLTRITRLEHDARGRVTRSVDARDKATVYAYGAFDHLERVTDPAGNVTTYEVDALGRTRTVNDPDLGARSLTYNAFGQLETLTDAKGQLTRFVYDGLGRPLERHDVDGTSFFVYDETPFGVGKLHRTLAPGGAERTLTYDSKGRLHTSQLRASLGDTKLTFIYGYDEAQFGRLRTLDYPVPVGAAPYRVRYGYDAFGHLERLTDDVSQAELWRQLAPDAAFADRQTRERFGNGIETTRTFEPTSGLLAHLRSVKPGAGGAEAVRQDLRYRYTHHRLLWQVDDAAQVPSARETFGYDVLDRLTLDAVQGATGPRRDTTYDYDATGNLTHKSDLGAGPFVYGTATPEGLRRPHALTGLGAEVYAYDANGNQTKRPGATVTYNALDQPKSLTAANQPTTEFFYDALGARVRKRAFGSVETVTFDERYERRRLGNDTKHTFYVRAGSELVATVERTMIGTVVTGSSTRYVHPNHQGSIDVVTGAGGGVLQARSYDPFGRARNPDWSTSAPPQGAALLRRGFTEHEHDDEFGLIHMRGRVYDPRTGRFLQADPFVPNPLNGQSYNRYSYVRNSAPNLVDPSGYAECATDPCQKKDHLPGATLGSDGVYHTDNHDRNYWVDEVTIVGDRREEGPPSGLTGPFPFGGGPVGGQGPLDGTDGSGCRGCDQGLDERRGGRWGGGVSGGWQSETDPGPQRSSETHSPSPGYATDDAFGGTGGPYPASPADARALELARGVSQAWQERGGELLEKAAWAEMTALKVIWETIALQQVAQLGQTIGSTLSKACFVAGTEVWTAEGLVPIERVGVGDLVLSRNEGTGELGWKVVVRTFVTPGQEVLALRLADAERGEHEEVEATAEHPFQLEGRGWVGAGELVPGQRVLRADGRWLRVESVEARGGVQTVYNLEVEDFHTYVVGQLGAWVHNACGTGWLGKASNRIGKEAESKLKELLGPGAQKKTFPTPFGKRKADSVLEEIIHEAKAGYVNMSKRISSQIEKDSWLKATRNVKDVEWHFFRSSKSGEIGPSAPLREALEEAGFKIHEHLLRTNMVAKMSNEYCLVQPPFDRNPRDMMPKERKSYYAWFLSIIPERLEQLSSVVKRTVGFEAWQPDFAPQSLDVLGRWFAGQSETRLRTPEEMEELRAQIQAALPGVEPPERTLTHRTVSLSLDVGIYLGQVLISTVDGIRWQQASGGKTSVDFGQPVLVGLPLGDCNPIRLTLVLASAIADGSRDGSGLRELYDIWTGKKPITLPRFKQR